METPSQAASRQVHVLVVEDEEAVGRVMSRLLEREGCKVLVAGNAEDAIAYTESGAFDLILTDISLPGMMGLSAISEFKKRSGAPIVVMTGYADEDIRTDALLLGATWFLGKPLDFDQVRGIIRALPEHPHRTFLGLDKT